jgi:hypothetical protein
LKAHGEIKKESDKLVHATFAAIFWRGLSDHEQAVYEDRSECSCDRSNEKIRCFFYRLAAIPEVVSAEAAEKARLRICKQISEQYVNLNAALEEVGGSAWVIACIPNRSVPDLDNAVGHAANALANDLEKKGIRMQPLLRSRQTLVDIENSHHLTAELSRSESLQEQKVVQEESGEIIHAESGSERRGRLQEVIRSKLRILLQTHGVRMTKKNQLPPGIWNNYQILNWPSNESVNKLNSIGAKECNRILSVIDTVRIRKRGAETLGFQRVNQSVEDNDKQHRQIFDYVSVPLARAARKEEVVSPGPITQEF